MLWKDSFLKMSNGFSLNILKLLLLLMGKFSALTVAQPRKSKILHFTKLHHKKWVTKVESLNLGKTPQLFTATKTYILLEETMKVKNVQPRILNTIFVKRNSCLFQIQTLQLENQQCVHSGIVIYSK